MKRDMDLVRTVLLAVEASESVPLEWVDLEIEGESIELVSYQIQLLFEAGLLDADDASSMRHYEWKAKRLTWAGHEFLDSVRDPEVWAKTKEGAKKVGGFGLDLVAALARGFIKQKVKQATGIELEL